MLAKLARGLYLAALAMMIVAYAVTAANSNPPPQPAVPDAAVIQWC
jgi:hypothetical protein